MAGKLTTPQLHVLVTTHTTRHLRVVLLGIACSSVKPDTVVISSDNDNPQIKQLLKQTSSELGMAIHYTCRAFTGSARPAQTRNNGLRLLQDHNLVSNGDLVAFLDGDSCPAHDLFERQLAASVIGDVLLGWRLCLSDEQTQVLDEDLIRNGHPPISTTPEALSYIKKRHHRFVRQKWLAMFGLTKKHKPKILGANHAVKWDFIAKINGYDESFSGWGHEDDDFARRLYGAKARPYVGITNLMTYHLYHPTRPQNDAQSLEAEKKLNLPFQVRAEYGLNSPQPQDSPQQFHFTPQ